MMEALTSDVPKNANTPPVRGSIETLLLATVKDESAALPPVKFTRKAGSDVEFTSHESVRRNASLDTWAPSNSTIDAALAPPHVTFRRIMTWESPLPTTEIAPPLAATKTELLTVNVTDADESTTMAATLLLTTSTVMLEPELTVIRRSSAHDDHTKLALLLAGPRAKGVDAQGTATPAAHITNRDKTIAQQGHDGTISMFLITRSTK